MERRTLALLTSGGDAPGMNAAIRAAALLGLSRDLEVLGVRQGYVGLMAGDFVPLTRADVTGIVRDGGTVLGSARCPEFQTPDGRAEARRRMAEAGITDLVVIGGNGSLTGARALTAPEELGDQVLRIAGIPASIDNDVGLSGLSIGVDTAMNTIVDACDKIADTASAHGRTFIVEVMGRDCGYLAMSAGVAAGADLVLFPEAGRDDEQVVEVVVKTIESARRRALPPKRVLILKAEGVRISPEQLKTRVEDRLHADGHRGALVETRIAVLGHIVRGGRPSAFDRVLAGRLGFAAVRALLAGETRVMAAWAHASAPPPGARLSEGDPHCWIVTLDAVLAETARLLDGTSPLVRWRNRVFAEIESVLNPDA
jgi:6-phosphofructokinase 1